MSDPRSSPPSANAQVASNGEKPKIDSYADLRAAGERQAGADQRPQSIWPIVAARIKTAAEWRVNAQRCAAVVIAITIFLCDLFTEFKDALAVLYIASILLVAQDGRPRLVLATGCACTLLATVAFMFGPFAQGTEGRYARFLVSVIAIMATTFLSMRSRQTDAAFQESERRYRTIFHSVGFPTWEADWSRAISYALAATPEGHDFEAYLLDHPEVVRAAASRIKIVRANQAAADLFKVSLDDLLMGGNVIKRFTVNAEKAVAHVFSGIASGHETVELDADFRTVLGTPLEMVVHFTCLADGASWSRILVTGFDYTERNEARARLEQASAELAHASRVSTLGQLAASIAHEVSQPLGAIVNYGHSGRRWMSRETPDMSEIDKCFKEIVSNASRAANVIAGVRAMARNTSPKAEPIDLIELIGETLSLVRQEARASKVLLTQEFDDSISWVFGDRVQVQQVLVNLVTNGIHAMQGVTDRPRELTISVGRDGQEGVSIRVRDQGTGIAKEIMPRIFRPFFSTKASGMGMGLSICRSIVEAQCGHIAAENNPDHGATVTFTLRCPPRAVT